MIAIEADLRTPHAHVDAGLRESRGWGERELEGKGRHDLVCSSPGNVLPCPAVSWCTQFVGGGGRSASENARACAFIAN